MFIFDNFLREIDEKLSQKNSDIVLGRLEDKYEVNFQKTVKDIAANIENYENIIGVALTAEELAETEEQSENSDGNLKTDIVIENFKNTLMIIEVKRTSENCMNQLDRQIKSIMNIAKNKEINIKYEKVSLKWENVVHLLEKFIHISKREDIIIQDYYEYLKNHYKQWFPVKSLNQCEDDVDIKKRIERLRQNIENLSKNTFELYHNTESDQGFRVDWGYTNRIQFFYDKISRDLKILIHPCATKDQFYSLISKSNLSFITEFKNNQEPIIQNPNIKLFNNISSILRIGRVRGSQWVCSSELDKNYYLGKKDYEEFNRNLCGRWYRDNNLNDFVKDGKILTEEIKKINIKDKENFIENDIRNKVIHSGMTQLHLSLGFIIEITIPITELAREDNNFDTKKDIDELAKLIYELMIEYKNKIEQ